VILLLYEETKRISSERCCCINLKEYCVGNVKGRKILLLETKIKKEYK